MAAAAATSHDDLMIRSPPSMSESSGFPVLAVAILGIAATAFLLLSYYIFITNKCCWCHHPFTPTPSQQHPHTHTSPISSSPSSQTHRGLNDLLIRQLPTFHYTTSRPRLGTGTADFSRCVVCLSDFQDNEMLRVLPKCTHAFHLDCIDLWLLNNSNCPLCRSTISGRNRYHEMPPNSWPQDDFVVIEITSGSGDDGIWSRQGDQGAGAGAGGSRSVSRSNRFQLLQPRRSCSRKFHHKTLRKWNHFSILGDEGIDGREMDQHLSLHPIRRSFSMDSVADLAAYYLSVQEILRQEDSL